MAFSRSEDRGIRSASITCPLSTPPTSPSYLQPKAEDAVVDADDIERWLTSPSKLGSTDDLAIRASNGESTTRLRLADVTVRRRSQQIQWQNQPSPRNSKHERQKDTQETQMTSNRTSLRQGKLAKERQDKEPRKYSHRDSEAPKMNSSQKQEAFRQTAAMTIAGVEEGSSGYSHTEKLNAGTGATVKKDDETTKNRIPSEDNNVSQKKEKIDSNNERTDVTMIKGRVTSPGIAAIRRRRQQRLQRRESEKELKEVEDDKQTQCIEPSNMTTKVDKPEDHMNGSGVAIPSQSMEPLSRPNAAPLSTGINRTKNEDNLNCDDDNHGSNMDADNHITNEGKMNSEGNDGRVFSVSRTKKIHLLKRHNGGKGGSPLVRKIDNDATLSSQNDSRQITISSDDNSVSTIARLRMIRRQMADGTNRCTHEHQHELEYAHEQRSLLAAADNSLATDEGPEKVTTENTTNNTKLIKDALARSRSYRRSISKRNVNHGEVENDVRKCGESYGERALKNHFRSSSIPCASVISTGTSTISVGSDGSSCRSNNGQTCEDGNAVGNDEEISTTTSVSETTTDDEESDEDGLSLPPIPQESNQTATVSNESLPNISCLQETPTSDMLSPEDEQAATELILNQESSESSSDEESIEKPATSLVPSSAPSKKQNERKQLALQRKECTSRIKLHVYDLVADDTQLDLWGCHFPLGQVFNAFNSSLHSIGTGAYHVGLEINGIEYAYGANSTKGMTGIFTCTPKCSPGYQFRTTIDFGNRVVKKKPRVGRKGKGEVVDGQEIVRGMATEYLGTDYDLLRKNCCTFAHDVCISLGIHEDEIPSWFHNLAAAGAITQDAASYTLAPITQLFAGNELDKFNDYLNENALNDKLEAIQDSLPEKRKDHEFVADTSYQF